MSIKVDTMPQVGIDVIRGYEHLQVAPNVFVRCPYYRNPSSGVKKWGLSVFSGKGSPQDIEEELKIIEKLEGVTFGVMSPEDVEFVMRKYRLGVDCAGFIAHVMDAWMKESTGRPLVRHLVPYGGFLQRIFWRFRPFTHMSVRALISEANSFPSTLSEVLPGDLMVFLGEIDHAAIVVSVKREEGRPIEVSYAHSAYEKGDGKIKTGVFTVENTSQGSVIAKIKEYPDTGVCITHERSEPLWYRLRCVSKIR